MKRITAILLLCLLLYNTFGLSIAVLLFKNDFQLASKVSNADEWKILKFEVPSLPYTSSWENEDGLSGLVEHEGQFYNTTNVLLENDTVYVTLKSNLSARDRFFDLADKIEKASHQESTQNEPNKAVKLLGDLLKIYLNRNERFAPQQYLVSIPMDKHISFRHLSNLYQTLKTGHLSPPPEAC